MRRVTPLQKKMLRRVSPGTLILCTFLQVLPEVHSQSTTPSPALAADAERAIVRSQEDLVKAQTLMSEAKRKRSENNLEGAYLDAVKSLQLAPSGPAADPARNALVADYASIALQYAVKLAKDGVFTDSIAEKAGLKYEVDNRLFWISAESVAKSVLSPEVDPKNKQAVQFLSDLEQSGVYNKTITPAFAAKRDRVVKLLRDAQGYAQSGRNELAIKAYDEVLQLDPYNNAARKGMEAVHDGTMKYADEAYNETRARMLWQVEKAWERPPHKTKQGRSTESVGRQQDNRGTDQIVAKLNSIIIPKIDLSDSPISEAVEYLKQKCVEQDPDKKGVNIFLKLNGAASTPGATSGTAPVATEPHVTLSLTHVPLYVALDYITRLCNPQLKLKIDPYAVAIVPLSENTDVMVQKEYQVPPTFIPPKSLDASGALPQAGAPVSDANKARVASRHDEDAKEYLLSQGIEFPEGAGATYRTAGSKLVVRNTRDQIDRIDALVDAAMGVAPSQVDIQTKFLEINQNNIQELGFDWLLGPFSIGGGVYGSGGGGSNALSASGTYPFSTDGMNPVGALRSGDQAISGNSIDALIANQSGATALAAPGIFSIAGVYTDPQFQLVIHALNQKKGIDLMSAPKVTTKSGVKATVKIVDEFMYPRQYDPPQIPQSTGQNGTVVIGAGGAPQPQAPPTVTPSFPRDITTKNLGVILEAKPTIGPDGYTIDLELHPQVTDFDGFINYGSPINSIGYQTTLGTAGLLAIPIPSTATTNTIDQPVFTTREVNTFVTVWDGQTVALGGLIREDVQKTQDKIPFLGDIPLAGRLFRSDADQKLKKNLIIFVTPRILDAEGQPRRGDSEEPEIVKPIGLPQEQPTPAMSAVRTK